MFFPHRIHSIKHSDSVLEIGPGAHPYHRSDVLLEKKYDFEEEYFAQCGNQNPNIKDKKIVYYEGEKFPFQDNSFDYTVCSHVLEHVENPDFFMNEIQRVSKKGYIEFPLIYYDFIYDIPEHLVFLYYKDNVIKWMRKKDTTIGEFSLIQKFFKLTLDKHYFSLVDDLKPFLFQGFEWFGNIKTQKVTNIEELCHDLSKLQIKQKQINIKKTFIQKLKNKLDVILK